MFDFKSIQDYQTGLTQGYYTCVEAVDHYLSRIKEYEHLNAYNRVYAEESLARAAELDRSGKTTGIRGRLHGVVVGIKDVICYKDHPVTASSKMLENFTSLFSATAVERLIEEGAIIIGHLNCDEFAMGSTNEHSFFGRVLNPLDQSLVPGGSSGGSAAAQAAGLCMIALGSDTGGSVRQPADFCGVIGLKPSYGRISRHGLIAYASSFDHIGIFSSCVEDAATVLEIISGADDRDGTALTGNFKMVESNDRKFRVACISSAFEHPSLDPGIKESIEDTLEQLRQDGNTVNMVDFDMLDLLVPAYYILTTAEASSNLSRYDGIRYGYRTAGLENDLGEFYSRNRSEAFGIEVKRRIMLGTFVLSAGYYDAYFHKAQQVRQLVKEKLNKIFNDHDVIVLPNSPTTAYPLNTKISDPVTMYLADIYTVMANLAGIPAISLPLYRSKAGKSYGIQVMSGAQNEVNLLQVSKNLMKFRI